MLVDGQDRLPELLDRHGEEIAEDIELPAWLLQQLGVVPSYYLRYFYDHDQVVRELLSSPSRASQVAEIERELLEMYGDERLDTKPELLTQPRRRVLLGGGRGAVRGAARAVDGGRRAGR